MRNDERKSKQEIQKLPTGNAGKQLNLIQMISTQQYTDSIYDNSKLLIYEFQTIDCTIEMINEAPM